MKFWLTALLALQLTQTQNGFAYESEEGYGYQDLQALENSSVQYEIKQNDASRFQKFETALEALGIPPEQDPDFTHFVHANEVNQKEVQQNLQWIDPDQGLARYLSLVNGNLQMFRDFFKSMMNLNFLEYQQTLSTDNPSNDSSALLQRLKIVANQTRSNPISPLRGLKILIDPGHMGGDDWDQFTGKFVSVNGRKVSEGALNLWTSLLTAQKLEKLGATVMLTREKLGSVAMEDPAHFDTTPFVNQYFYNSMDDWMAPYLEKSIDEVRKTIKNASEVKRAYSQTQRDQFFITGLDLEARSKMIDQFDPDITLDIHFDASNVDKLQNTTQSLEAFVPGSFRKNETGSRRVRAMALKHLLEVRRWNQSVELADQVTQSMSAALKIPRLNQPEAFTAMKVKEGVYARNLYISRRAFTGLVLYLECMHYDHVKEHARLATRDRTGFYHATSFQYPNRLDALSDSIQNGILAYFKNMKN